MRPEEREPATVEFGNAEQSLADLLERLTRKLDADEAVDIDKLVREYPQHANRLCELMPTILAMASWGRAPDSSAKNEDEATGSSALSGVLGDFRIVRELGRGGMGTVFEAEQMSMGRCVALKVLPFAALAQEKALQRFRNEVRAVAALDHPHIVSVYSVGEERGIHYYAMQLIRGQTLADLIHGLRRARQLNALPAPANPDPVQVAESSEAPTIGSTIAAPLPTKREAQSRISTSVDTHRDAGRNRVATELMIQAAEALQHAHDQGVLHRDIKPGNLLLDAEGKLYVTDFGLARIGADTGMTMTGDIIGTLRYMAPEQALAKRVVIDHRADIYSLGATFYELLALQPVFGDSDRSELLKRIAFEEPTPLRKLDRRISPELETIVLKALAKNPDERYQTAQLFAEDLSAYLEHRPIVAKPPTVLDRAAKWSRRHMAFVWAAVAALVLLTLTLSISTLLIWNEQGRTAEALAHAHEQTTRATQNARVAQWNQYVANMYPLAASCDARDFGQLERLLTENEPGRDEADFRGWEWSYFKDQCAQAFFSVPGAYPAWHPQREELAVLAGSADQLRIDIWDANTERCIDTIPIRNDKEAEKTPWTWTGTGEPLTIGYAAERVAKFAGPAGLKWTSSGAQLCCGFSSGRVAFYDRKARTLASEHVSEGQNMRSFDVSPDGKLLATSNWQGKVEIWDIATGHSTRVVNEAKEVANSTTIVLNTDATQLAAALSWGVRKTWNTTSWDVFDYVSPTTSRGWLAWNESGTRFAATEESSFSIYATNRAKPLKTLSHPSVARVCWVGDDHLVSSGFDHSIKVWDIAAFQLMFELRLHDSPVGEVAVSPSKTRLASSSRGQIKVCALSPSLPPAIILKPTAPRKSEFHFIAWDGTGTLLASGHQEVHGANAFLSPLRIWNVNEKRIMHEQEMGDLIRSLAVNMSSQAAWATTIRGMICRMDLSTGSLNKIDAFSKGAFVSKSSFSPDGEQLAMGDREQVKLIDLASRTISATLETPYRPAAIAWSPNSRRIAVGAWNHLIVWSPSDNTRFDLENNSSLSSIDWSPIGGAFVAGRRDGDIMVVDTDGQEIIATLRGHAGDVTGLDWAANGRRIASSSIDSTVRVWDAATGDQLVSFEHPEKLKFLDVEWSPDNRRLAAGDSEGCVFIWGSQEIEDTPTTSAGLSSGIISDNSR